MRTRAHGALDGLRCQFDEPPGEHGAESSGWPSSALRCAGDYQCRRCVRTKFRECACAPLAPRRGRWRPSVTGCFSAANGTVLRSGRCRRSTAVRRWRRGTRRVGGQAAWAPVDGAQRRACDLQGGSTHLASGALLAASQALGPVSCERKSSTRSSRGVPDRPGAARGIDGDGRSPVAKLRTAVAVNRGSRRPGEVSSEGLEEASGRREEAWRAGMSLTVGHVGR